ncbi:hypothetical protein HanPI659440_Chr04g0169891 [Helianthus annuus]|nr:hypothetical protein HanPI659440_Chr04g0169891 [Helianthus annuus]
MGDCKLKVNVARFAVENSGVIVEPEVRAFNAKASGQGSYGNSLNLRDARKYSEVVGTSKEGGVSIKLRKEEGNKAFEKTIVVPDRIGAFSNLYGLALVGRTVDLETLVDFDRLLRIAKTIFSGAQRGLETVVSKLDPWNGQTLPLERVAWLKLSGIPLHLFDGGVLGQVGEVFGKVLHVPMCFDEDQDLSISRVGFLVGTADVIREGVSMRWKDRRFRIWVEEDLEDWVPECLGSSSSSEMDEGTSAVSLPIVNMQDPVGGVFEETQVAGADGGAKESRGVNDPPPHADPFPMHVEREGDDGFVIEEVDKGSGNVEGNQLGSKEVGPEEVIGFKCGSGDTSGRPKKRPVVGNKSRKVIRGRKPV